MRALVNKNSAFCPDRPSPDDEITTGPLRSWHEAIVDDVDQCWSTDGPAAKGSLQGGQESPSAVAPAVAPTMFILAEGRGPLCGTASQVPTAALEGPEVGLLHEVWSGR
jgi:hypothetical protein